MIQNNTGLFECLTHAHTVNRLSMLPLNWNEEQVELQTHNVQVIGSLKVDYGTNQLNNVVMTS